MKTGKINILMGLICFFLISCSENDVLVTEPDNISVNASKKTSSESRRLVGQQELVCENCDDIPENYQAGYYDKLGKGGSEIMDIYFKISVRVTKDGDDKTNLYDIQLGSCKAGVGIEESHTWYDTNGNAVYTRNKINYPSKLPTGFTQDFIVNKLYADDRITSLGDGVIRITVLGFKGVVKARACSWCNSVGFYNQIASYKTSTGKTAKKVLDYIEVKGWWPASPSVIESTTLIDPKYNAGLIVLGVDYPCN